jgi:hypothetical protein
VVIVSPNGLPVKVKVFFFNFMFVDFSDSLSQYFKYFFPFGLFS